MEASDILELGVINAERGKKLLPLMLEVGGILGEEAQG